MIFHTSRSFTVALSRAIERLRVFALGKVTAVGFLMCSAIQLWHLTTDGRALGMTSAVGENGRRVD